MTRCEVTFTWTRWTSDHRGNLTNPCMCAYALQQGPTVFPYQSFPVMKNEKWNGTHMNIIHSFKDLYFPHFPVTILYILMI